MKLKSSHVLLIFVLLESFCAYSGYSQNIYTKNNAESQLGPFSTVNGQWYSVNPTNNTLGANYYQGLNFGFDSNNYSSIVNPVGTSDLYFGQWSWGWKDWRKIIIANENGNVGFGTSMPKAKIHIYNSYSVNNNIGLKMFYEGSWGTADYASNYRFFDVTSTEGGKIFEVNGYGVGIGYDPPKYASNDKLYINGNVGIGTTTPTTKLDVRGIISTPEIAFRNLDGGDNSDPYRLRKVQGSSNNNWLELQLNDDPDESFRIYGNSCAGFGCGEYSGNLYHSFDAQGNVFHRGNLGIDAINPTQKLQIGDYKNSQNYKLNIPGTYSFEEIKLGQYGNGASGLEMISHVNTIDSYGVRLFSSTDSGINGLQIQTAAPTSSANALNYSTKLVVNLDGNVGIGTIDPKNKLSVNGNIWAKEVKVSLTDGADYVFQKYYTGKSDLKSDYVMPTLNEVEQYTKINNHLPSIPSAQEMKDNGLELGKMNNLLLQKIEELTLYVIEQQKEIQILKEKINK